MAKERVRLLVFNDPHAMRIDSRLAKEIGFDESVVFLQLEYLIGISQHEREGHLWTFQSLRTLNKEQFPWWSPAKLLRIIKRLEERELILVGNFNKTEWDKTQWFALNEVGIGRLKSVSLAVDPFQNETPTRFKMKHRCDQNETALFQNETTIPKTTPETNLNNDDVAPSRVRKTADKQHEVIGKQSDPRDILLKDLKVDSERRKSIIKARPELTIEEIETWRPFLANPPDWSKAPVGVMITYLRNGDPVSMVVHESRSNNPAEDDLLWTNPDGTYNHALWEKHHPFDSTAYHRRTQP